MERKMTVFYASKLSFGLRINSTTEREAKKGQTCGSTTTNCNLFNLVFIFVT